MTRTQSRREVHQDDTRAIQRWLDEGGRDVTEESTAADRQGSLVSVEDRAAPRAASR